FAEAARQHFGGDLTGTLTVTAGLGGMGGAQPLAVRMNGGVCLVAEVEQWRIDKRLETRYLDKAFSDLDIAIDQALKAKAAGQAQSIGIRCNIVDLLMRLQERKITPDLITDQTSAHDPDFGYFPYQISLPQAKMLREDDLL